MTENRTFWKTGKPFLTDKTKKTSRIILIEEERVISQDHQIVKLFPIIPSIPIKNMPKNQEYESFDSSEEYPVSSIIKKYRIHRSIKLIKTKNKSKTFRFRETNTDEIKKFIEKLYPKEASQKFDMSNAALKNAAFFTKCICNGINALIRSSKFHNELKEVYIVLVHKEMSKFSKENYRSIGLFPNISKA